MAKEICRMSQRQMGQYIIVIIGKSKRNGRPARGEKLEAKGKNSGQPKESPTPTTATPKSTEVLI